MFPALLAAGANIVGGLLGSQSAAANRDLQARLNDQMLADKEKDRALQREFAQSGIQWRTEDARKAGIHPLAALGGSGASYTPSAISLSAGPADNSMGTAIAAAGQDISRAMNATRTKEQRDDAYTSTVKQLTLQKMGLENDLLASQIAKLKVNSNPPMPSATQVGPVPEADKFEDRPKLRIGGTEISTDPRTSNAEDAEKRYGEVSDWFIGPAVLWQDYMNTAGGAEYRARHNPFHNESRNPARRWWQRELLNKYLERR